MKKGNLTRAFKGAFKVTMPIFFGYIPVGIAFGLICEKSGYNFIWAFFISLFLFSGSMQFVLINLLTGGAGILETVITTLIVNARYSLYGISFVDFFKKMKKIRPYMIHILTDEVYAIMCSAKTPLGVNRKQFFFAIGVLCHGYWILGCVLGALLGSILNFNSQGMEFAMTALFVVIFIDQLLTFSTKIPNFLGITTGALCLIIFGAKNMLIPSIFIILFTLLILKNKLEKDMKEVKKQESIKKEIK